MVTTSDIRSKVVEVAISNLHYGEVGDNNYGQLIIDIGGQLGSPWCAAFAGYCYSRAYQLLSSDTEPRLLPFARSLSAKRLTKNLGAVGRMYKDPMKALKGDLVCFNRGFLGWQGHVEIVEWIEPDGIIHTIAGNTGPFPSKVRRLVHDVDKMSLYSFASLERI